MRPFSDTSCKFPALFPVEREFRSPICWLEHIHHYWPNDALSGRALGRPISNADAQIAVIAQVRRARLATRNLADFEDCGLDIAPESQAHRRKIAWWAVAARTSTW